MSDEKILAKKDVTNSLVRMWLHGQDGWNYEKMQGLGYAYSVLPILKKIYKDDEEGLYLAVKNHMQFFSGGFYTMPLILGSTIAIEEREKRAGQETVAAVKTGLMGPLAGVHDALFQTTFKTVFGSIAANMALQCSTVGIWLWIAANIGKLLIAFKFLDIGYRQGVKLVTAMGTQLKRITECAQMLGLTMVGALIPSVVKAQIPFVFQSGETEMAVQGILDKVMPSLLPALIVAVIYWLLGKKKFNTIKAVFALVVFSVVCSFFGILG